jgi:hypothetical protein
MRLRFFFDAGAGICLWAQDEAAKARFGYPVELDELGLSNALRSELMQLMADYDATIDWDDPGKTGELDTGPTVFGHEADAPLADRVRDVLPRLRAALGPGFKIESSYED